MKNPIDALIAYINPQAGIKRRAARAVLSYYEAAEPTKTRKFRHAGASQNEQVQRGAVAVRTQARHLCQNHDISRGILRVLVNAVVGPNGIGVEPQPRRADGSIHAEYASALLEAYRDWCRVPDVTGRMPWSRLQRAMARAWLRDGEVFAQMITGTRSDLNHGTLVPFSLEAFESELVPMDYQDPAKNILQGIERNTWGKPIAIHVLKTNPASLGQYYSMSGSEFKRIPWDRMLHLATLDHIGQIRGVSEFASIINRLEDIKDYEESERVAAKIAAMLTAYVKRGTPELYDPADPNAATGREIHFKPGMIIDDLAVGEDIGLIDSNRPNPNLITFRQGQLRAVAAGVGASNSSISKDYNGSYSAQRQELVEQWTHYAVLCDEFVGEIVQPVWEQFVMAAHLSGVVRMPADLKPGTHNDAMYTAQAMPWIDPMKEAAAAEKLVAAGFASEYEIIRRRGANPETVLEQIKEFREKAKKAGLHFTTMPEQVADAPVAVLESVSEEPAARAEIDRIHARIDTINRPKPEAAAPVIPPQPINVAVHMAPSPATEIHTHNHVEPAAAPIVNIENVAPSQPAPIVTVEAIMPEQLAPIVHVTNQQEAATVTVNIPARKTETTVTRDAAGQITGSTQIETDAEAL